MTHAFPPPVSVNICVEQSITDDLFNVVSIGVKHLRLRCVLDIFLYACLMRISQLSLDIGNCGIGITHCFCFEL